MAVLDVSENGVVLNSVADAQANATAIVDMAESVASANDTIDFGMGEDDVLWLDTTEAALARVVDLNGSDMPDGLTFTNNTGPDGRPAGVIRASDSLSVQSYFFEMSVRDGMDVRFENLEFDANDRNNGNADVAFLCRDGDASNITFRNCLFRNGRDVSFRELDASGSRLEYCTMRDATEQHGCAVTHRTLSTATATEFYRCHFTNNGIGGSGGGFGLNQSPGKTRVIECVIEGNKRGVKWGTDPGYVGNFPVDYQRVRIGNCQNEGVFILADDTVHEVTHSVEDVIIDGAGDGLLTGGSAEDQSEVRVAQDSQFVVLGSADNNLDFRGASTVSTAPGAEIQSCGAGGDGFRYASSQDSTIRSLNVASNAGDAVNDTAAGGTLTVTTQTSDACATDLAGVPTASEVGVGSATKAAAPTSSRNGRFVSAGGFVASAGGLTGTLAQVPAAAVESYESDLSAYNGDVASFSTVADSSLSFSAIDGGSVLEVPASSSFVGIYSTSLSTPVSKGEVVHVYFRQDALGDELEVRFGLEDDDNHYLVQIGDDFARLRKRVAGSLTTLEGEFGFGWPAGTWCRLEITWDDGTLGGVDGDISLDVYSGATGSNDGTLVGSLSANDTDGALQGNTGIGAYTGGGTTSTFYLDYWSAP